MNINDEIGKNGDEIKIDFNINPDKAVVISGYVFSTRCPIKNACIKVVDSDYYPIIHGYTNCKGVFYIKYPITSRFRIIISAENYETFSSEVFYIGNIKLPLKIKLKPKRSKGVIVGKLVDCNENNIEYTRISIKGTNKHTFSNVDGEFIINDLNRGCYILSINSPFYKTVCIRIKISKFKNIYDIKTIQLESKNYTGTVNGVIYDDKNNCITGALVMLLNQKDDKIIDYTYTNENGVYLFGNVPLGRYYIKSTK